jgi:hypothetical protein
VAKQPIAPDSRSGFGPTAPTHGNGFARPEAVARALGYTEKEQAVADDILKRFVWRYAAQPAEENTNAGGEDSFAADDLEAAS